MQATELPVSESSSATWLTATVARSLAMVQMPSTPTSRQMRTIWSTSVMLTGWKTSAAVSPTSPHCHAKAWTSQPFSWARSMSGIWK